MKRLGELANFVGGQLNGNPDLEIEDVATIGQAASRHLTFVATQQHVREFQHSQAAAAIVPPQLAVHKPSITVDDPESVFGRIVGLFRPALSRPKIGISRAAHVSGSADIAEDVDIYPNAYIGDGVRIGCGSVIFPHVTILENCQIGSNVTLFPGVVIYENTIIGDRSTIHAGTVLGAYGFGYRSHDGQHRRSAQLGNVVIGCDVEIGANSTVDRGTFDSTIIGEGTKIDDQVMIGHNCRIGKHNLLCSQVGIAGSCQTGDNVVMGGQVGIGDHLVIGERAQLGAKAGVMQDIPAGQAYVGIPATPARKQMQILACKAKLPDMRRQISQLAEQVDQIEQRIPWVRKRAA